MTAPGLTHAPATPAWSCVEDGDEWPCNGAKRELRRLFSGRPAQLAAYLADRMAEAHGDLPAIAQDDLLRRFVLWPDRETAR